MKRKLICMLLSVVLVLSIMVPVAAEDISRSGNSGTSRVTLDLSTRNLRVTVPSVLPIDVDSDNNVTVATNASINNLSDGSVEVTNVAVDAKNDWTIVPFATDFTKVPVDTKQFGMTMYDDDVANGVPASLFDVIEGSSQLPVRYNGTVAIQSNTIHHLDIGHVVFTVAWHRGLHYYSSLSLAASDLNAQTTENADVANYEDAVCGLTIGENTSRIEVLKNINNQESVTLSENAIFDLNHHTIDFAEGTQLLAEKDLAIYSGNIEGENSKIIKSEGNTILDNVEVSVDYTSEVVGTTVNLKNGASITNSKFNVSVDNNADIYALQVTNGDCLLKNSEINAETAPNGTSPLVMGCYFENCNNLIINNSKINVGETSGGVVTQARGCYINKCSNTTIDGTIIDERCSTFNGTDLRGNGLQIAGNSLNNITIGRNAPNTFYGSNSAMQVGGNVNMNIYDSYFASPNHGVYMSSKGQGSVNVSGCTIECLPTTSDRYVEGVDRSGAFYCASSFNGDVNLDNVQLIGGTHGLRIKNYNNAETANVSIDNSDVYGDSVAFSIDLGTLTIGKNTTTHGPYSYAEIQNNGGTVIDNRN